MEPICKRCLLEGIGKEQFEKTVDAYIESLPEELKADSATLRNRLSLCDQCDQLASGVCRICGCFVRARAAKRPSHCPAIEPKW